MNTKLPDITTHFAEWYQEIVYQAELVDHAPVRGSMVVRPYGWSIWENVKGILDDRIKKTGHQNASFPLLIPESFLKKEAEHVEGFAPELAVVTIAGGKKLEEPLVVRPTSETIIHYSFARWMKSWRDLPLKINQWANVVRWEMRPRPFLRTTEFFWQEGHTAHETYEEASAEAHMMLNEYVKLAHDYLAIPVIAGTKSNQEKFPGADKTLTFEAVMQDGKALQMGTSHLLSQNFAKSFEMQFQDRDGNLAHPFLTSWGTTTRLIGAVVMVHGDQKGLVLPPRIAPIQLVIVPIFKKGDDKEAVLAVAYQIKEQLNGKVRIFIDADEHKTPGSKFYHWEQKGVPLRLEIGPRDIAQNQAVMVDRLGFGKKSVAINAINETIIGMLDHIQEQLFIRAEERQKAMWHKSSSLKEFGPRLEAENGLYQTGFCGKSECEKLLKEYKGTTRCIIDEKIFKTCFACDSESPSDVIVAKSY